MNDLEQGWEALKTYAPGSGRAALLPIDRAVAAAGNDTSARQQLEAQLLSHLASSGSNAAREYICFKLALIGSDASVPALKALLADPELTTAARNALEVLPGFNAGKALRTRLTGPDDSERIGAINSVAVRRDRASVSVLGKLLHHPSPEIATAAAAALGEIGSRKAAQKLREFYFQTTDAMRARVADALLVCAEGLLAAGQNADSRNLYLAVSQFAASPHARTAATRGLEVCGTKS